MRRLWRGPAVGLAALLGVAAAVFFGPNLAQPHSAASLPPNTWVDLRPGGVATGEGIGDEGWSTFVYSPGLRRAIVFGKYHAARAVSWGEDQNALLGYDLATNRWDVLEITEAAWSEFLPGVGHDQGRVAIDPRRDRYITVGNMTLHGNTMYQTYVYDLKAGRGERMMPSGPAPVGHEIACAFASNHGYMLCTRGASWIYDPDKNVWSHVPGSPSDRAGPGLVYDEKHGVFVLFGGGAGRDETWVFDAAKRSWQKRAPAQSPPGRKGPNMAFDEANGIAFLAGGVAADDSRLGDAWVYDAGTNTWTELPSALPRPLGVPGGNLLTYDRDQRLLLLKESGNPALTTVWAFRYVPARAAGSPR